MSIGGLQELLVVGNVERKRSIDLSLEISLLQNELQLRIIVPTNETCHQSESGVLRIQEVLHDIIPHIISSVIGSGVVLSGDEEEEEEERGRGEGGGDDSHCQSWIRQHRILSRSRYIPQQLVTLASSSRVSAHPNIASSR